MKFPNLIGGFLGLSMFMFGALKFIDPFKGWYTVQITSSGLGSVAYAMGIIGELAVGAAFICLLIFRERFSFRIYWWVSVLASIGVVVMMATGTYVHLHPDAPADVLPLKVKPPVIPLFFLAAAVLNIMIAAVTYRNVNTGL